MADKFIPSHVDSVRPSFYVYIYATPNGNPFYVGKGYGDRYKINGHLRKNMLLVNKINKIGKENIVIKILHKDLTEEQAFYLEEKYIAGFGRRDLGLGPLCNLTNGGEGSSGFRHTEVSKLKMSEIKKNISQETREKLSIAHKGIPLPLELRLRKNKKLRGRERSLETKMKISKAKLGHVTSEATRKKISESMLRNQNAKRK